MSQGEGGGAPTKYKEEYIALVDDFIARRKEENKIPTIEGFAYEVGVWKDVIYDWMKKHKKFANAIKNLMVMQSDWLQAGIVNNKANVAGGIFLLKNNHGFKDRTEQDITSKGEKLPTPILNVEPNVIHTDDSNKENSESKTED
jgi:hypothetical protein